MRAEHATVAKGTDELTRTRTRGKEQPDAFWCLSPSRPFKACVSNELIPGALGTPCVLLDAAITGGCAAAAAAGGCDAADRSPPLLHLLPMSLDCPILCDCPVARP